MKPWLNWPRPMHSSLRSREAPAAYRRPRVGCVERLGRGDHLTSGSANRDGAAGVLSARGHRPRLAYCCRRCRGDRHVVERDRRRGHWGSVGALQLRRDCPRPPCAVRSRRRKQVRDPAVDAGVPHMSLLARKPTWRCSPTACTGRLRLMAGTALTTSAHPSPGAGRRRPGR